MPLVIKMIISFAAGSLVAFGVMYSTGHIGLAYLAAVVVGCIVGALG